MTEPVHTLVPLGALLAAGVLATAVLPRIGIPAILGYLATGILVGPGVTGVVSGSEGFRLLAEFGVVFLLFDIGLHFSLKEFWNNRRDFLALGPLQCGLSAAVIGAAAWGLGLAWPAALAVGASLALSSTAVALQTLHDRGERGTPLEHSAVALLVFQDLVAVALLAVIGAQAGAGDGESASLLATLGRALLALAAVAVAVLGRALRPVFAWVTGAGLDEAFTAAALLVVVATAGLTGMAGLSLPLGAFLGGMVLSESEYCYMIKTELKPFRGLLLGLFFISVGMSLNLAVIATAAWATLGVAVGLIGVKAALATLAARLSGSPLGLSLRLGFTLAQGSEFAFVLFGALVAGGVLAEPAGSILTAAVVASVAATPALAPLGNRLGAWVERRCEPVRRAAAARAQRFVLIDGATPAGLAVASALAATGHVYLVLDTNRRAIVHARAQGFAAGLGDLSDPRLTESMSHSPDALVRSGSTSPDFEAALQRLRQRRPRLTAIVAADTQSEANRLRALGVVAVDTPDDQDNRALAVQTLRQLDVAPTEIARWAGQFDENPAWERADKAHAA